MCFSHFLCEVRMVPPDDGTLFAFPCPTHLLFPLLPPSCCSVLLVVASRLRRSRVGLLWGKRGRVRHLRACSVVTGGKFCFRVSMTYLLMFPFRCSCFQRHCLFPFLFVFVPLPLWFPSHMVTEFKILNLLKIKRVCIMRLFLDSIYVRRNTWLFLYNIMRVEIHKK